ncbi:MAG: hypothetical protein ABIF10_02575 [Candidatus Woesearchaeota archaeon]
MEGDHGLRIPEPKPAHHDQYITLKIRPRTIERVFFTFVILALAGMLFYNTRSCSEPTAMVTQEPSISPQEPAATTAAPNEATAEITETTQLAATPETNATASDEAAPGEPVETDQEAAQEDNEGPIDPDLVEFKIEEVTILKKSDTWAKATAIKVSITNNGNRVRPIIKIYAWDDNTEDILSNHQEGEDWRYDPGVGKGEQREFTIETSISFSDLDLEKTVKARLYESTTNKLVKDSTKLIEIQ